MTIPRILIGIAAMLFLFLVGCNRGELTPVPDPISEETLHEVRIGTTVLDPEGVTLIAFQKENRMSFQMLREFSPKTFEDSISLKIFVTNYTQGWTNELSTGDIFANGTVTLTQNEWGSYVIYTGFHPFNYLERTAIDSFDELTRQYVFVTKPDYFILPGDELNIRVNYMSADYANSEKFLVEVDSFTMYCSRDFYQRPLGSDDMDTDGFVESLFLGAFMITDEDINLIPLSQVRSVNLDLNTQLNPYKFIDLVDVKIVINNLHSGQSFTIDTDTMFENGEIQVIDYVEGVVTYTMNHDMSYFLSNGIVFTPAQPGDLVEIIIDYAHAEDILENDITFQNKKFRVFYLGT